MIEFEFDAYEATPNSAWGSHLMGKKVITTICFVKSITYNNKNILINVSCLAIGSYFEDNNFRKQNFI
ncbi:hypothetical protein ASG22_04335 [Chryseobacterium sp. Leaf405]|nr:hypothetical protein ASG22_04335 [Chryseobacterium sp. Leaf405]